MKHEEVFNRHFIYDETSPTAIRCIKTGFPAGFKKYDSRYDTYNWVLSCKDNGNSYMWGLPFLIWELRTGQKPSNAYMINYRDVNKDNFDSYNMVLERAKFSVNKNLKKEAVKMFRNVILPRDNPDYYKDPADWTDPEALKCLADERKRRKLQNKQG
ncbi:hypothetical protein G7D34_003714 [Salmonella enterica]|nr:hypothetical protein [Salmonella enterica]